ncbi:flagellar basal body P-ring formation chaperone FlgA [Thorsellia kenyensis]|uniref:Flagella basal body P-ring formation protein FlgA n=1 Tax=Thorsellia kenyensis TaxID=1549888 RepID=A0ABV6CBR6_9GAMM
MNLSFKALFAVSIVFFTFPLQSEPSDDFISRAEFYIQEINPEFSTELEILALDKIPLDCPFPLFDLPNKRKTWGKTSLKISCDNKKFLLPINIIAFANVAIAVEDIKRGDLLHANNTAILNKEITDLSVAPITDVDLLYDAQALRMIPKDTVITFPMLKRAWAIRAGDTVTVKMSGNGFNAHNTGKAINNAYKGDKVRIRLENKTIIEGIVESPGHVSL